MKPYYSENGIVIYHGDCREVLPSLGRHDLLLTDPPFSETTHKNAKSNRGRCNGIKAIDFAAIDFAAIDFAAIESVITEAALHVERWLIAFLDWRHIAKLEQAPPSEVEFVRFGVWLKSNPMPQISADRPANGWDGIAYMHKRDTKKEWTGGGCHGNYFGPVITDGIHPTQKPIEFIRRLVERHCSESGSVLDPFMGSGTTLLAARLEGRQATGIEINERYCESAAKRLSQRVFEFEEAT